MSKKHDLHFVKEQFQKNNLELLSNEYKNCITKYDARCIICNYIWQTTQSKVNTGYGCPNCAGTRKKTIEEIQELYLKNNFKLLAKNYINSDTPLSTECLKCSHIWNIRYYDVKIGVGCPKCSGKMQYTFKEIQEHLVSKNIIFDDICYENTRIKYKLFCNICKYRWQAQIHSILQGSGCPSCSGNKRYTIEEVKDFFLTKNLIFLDQNYNNVTNKHRTKCLGCDLEFKTSFNKVKNGRGCIICSKKKSEKLATKYVNELLNITPTYKKIIMNTDFQKFCVVDMYIEFKNKTIFIEINGEQHYKPTRFGKDSLKKYIAKFEKQQKRDEWLRNYCSDNNISLIEVDLRKYKNEQIRIFFQQCFAELNLL